MPKFDPNDYKYPVQEDTAFRTEVAVMKEAIMTPQSPDMGQGEALSWLVTGYGTDGHELAYLHALMSDPKFIAIPIPACYSYHPNDAQADFFITTKENAERNFDRYKERMEIFLDENGYDD